MSSDLERLSRVIGVFYEFDAAFPASYIRAFLLVASKPGLSVTDYGNLLGVSQPIISRLLLQIGERSRAGRPGLGWVCRVGDSEDLRMKRVQLTPRGQELIQRLEQAMR